MNKKISADNPPTEVLSFSAIPSKSENFNRRDRVRLRIIRIALRMFLEHGYRKVTISDIADASAMSDRTFFRYFDSKEDILFFWTEWQRSVIHETLESEKIAAPPMEALRRSFEYLARLNEKNKDRSSELVVLILNTPELKNRYYAEHMRWQEELVETLADGKTPNESERFQLHIQAGVAISIYLNVIDYWATGKMQGTPFSVMVAQAYDALNDA